MSEALFINSSLSLNSPHYPQGGPDRFKKAVVLQQMCQWLKPQNNNLSPDWVRDIPERLKQQFPTWSDDLIQRMISNLEKEGLLRSFIPKGFKEGKYYALNYSAMGQIRDIIQTELRPLPKSEALDSQESLAPTSSSQLTTPKPTLEEGTLSSSVCEKRDPSLGENENLTSYTAEWAAILQRLSKILDPATVAYGFTHARLIDLTETHLTIQMDTLFKWEWIQNHFAWEVERAVREIYPSMEVIEYQVASPLTNS